MNQNTTSRILLMLLTNASTAIIILCTTLLIARASELATGKILWGIYSNIFNSLGITWCIILCCYIAYYLFKKIKQFEENERHGP